jgi:hypothetical protein
MRRFGGRVELGDIIGQDFQMFNFFCDNKTRPITIGCNLCKEKFNNDLPTCQPITTTGT